MKKIIASLLVAMSAMTLGVTAQASVIWNVNFGAEAVGGVSAYAGPGIVGGSSMYWNYANNYTNGYWPVPDSTGPHGEQMRSSTTPTPEIDGAYTYSSDATGLSSQPFSDLSGYISSLGASKIQMHVYTTAAGVAGATAGYLYIYTDQSLGADPTMIGQAGSGTTLTWVSTTAWSGDGSDDGLGYPIIYDVQKYSVTTTTPGSIWIENSSDGSINAAQFEAVVVPEPSANMLIGFGILFGGALLKKKSLLLVS
jgi:hypothetical protein